MFFDWLIANPGLIPFVIWACSILFLGSFASMILYWKKNEQFFTNYWSLFISVMLICVVFAAISIDAYFKVNKSSQKTNTVVIEANQVSSAGDANTLGLINTQRY
jgi:hypothetical protein